MLFFFIFVILVIVIIILWIVTKNNKSNAGKSDLEKYLARIEGFRSTKEFMGVDGICGIAVDEKSRKICLITKRERFSSIVISHQEILSAEIAEDGFPIIKVSRKSLIDVALPEGIPIVSAGGANDGFSETEEKAQNQVRKIELNVIVNNINEPVHTVIFLNGETEKGSVKYNIPLAAARQWHSRICILIQQADNENENTLGQVENGSKHQFVADEIKKLAELMNNGFISEEEFNLQKAKMLKET